MNCSHAIGDNKPQRKRKRPWLVAGFVLVALVCLVVLGEVLARHIAVDTVKKKLRDSMHLSVEQRIDVDIPGLVLPQIISGKIGRIETKIPDMQLAQVSGINMQLRVDNFPVFSEQKTLEQAKVRVEAPVSMVQDKLAGLQETNGMKIGFTDNRVVVEPRFPGFLKALEGTKIIVRPVAQAHNIQLIPENLVMFGNTVSLDKAKTLAGNYGHLLEGVLGTQTVCVADKIPRGVALTKLDILGDTVQIDADIADDFLTDTKQQRLGSC